MTTSYKQHFHSLAAKVEDFAVHTRRARERERERERESESERERERETERE